MNPIEASRQFVQEAYYELRKSSWLSRQEAIDSTKVVVAIVVLLSLFVAGIDFVVSIALRAILGR